MCEISRGLRRLFDAEIVNEHVKETGNSRDGSSSPGGANPASLESCLDSLNQGLELVPYDTATLRHELENLIAKYGDDTEVRELLHKQTEKEGTP